MNNFIVAEGEEAKRISEQSSEPSQKIPYVRLKGGESIRVRLLDKDFPSYYNHNDYEKRIPSHLCTAPRAGMSCKSCDAGIKRSIKYLVPLFNVDTQEVMLWDASKKHIQGLYALIDTYGDEVTSEVFQLKRTGNGAQDTTYSFIPLPPKQKTGINLGEVVAFERGTQERSDFYSSVLRPPTEEYLAKILPATVTPVVGNGTEQF